jgi:hypothetical protein
MRALGLQIVILEPLAHHFASQMLSDFVDNATKLSNDLGKYSLL